MLVCWLTNAWWELHDRCLYSLTTFFIMMDRPIHEWSRHCLYFTVTLNAFLEWDQSTSQPLSNMCVCAWVRGKEGGRERWRERQRLNFDPKMFTLGFGSGSQLSCSNRARLAKSRNFRPELDSHGGTWRLMRCQRYPGCVLAVKDFVSGNVVFVLRCL